METLTLKLSIYVENWPRNPQAGVFQTEQNDNIKKIQVLILVYSKKSQDINQILNFIPEIEKRYNKISSYPCSCKLLCVLHFFHISMFFLRVPSPLKETFPH